MPRPRKKLGDKLQRYLDEPQQVQHQMIEETKKLLTVKVK